MITTQLIKDVIVCEISLADNIDVKKIMDSIKKKTQNSYVNNTLQGSELKDLLTKRVSERKKSLQYQENKKYLAGNIYETHEIAFDWKELEHNLHQLNASYQINHLRPILSNRNKLIRWLALKIRHIIQGEIKFALDPIVHNQTIYNSYAVQTLNQITKNLKSTNAIINDFKDLISEHSQQLSDDKARLTSI
ncbi:MAG: hypothetical protein KGH89_00300, partial [Thaumarchaeota archaeon]|nr:hypothetical protein [Nitrososphaerota archaeon]